MTRAYSYIRFSTPEQRLGDSLRRQLEAARNFAAENNLVLDESLRDEGISAFSGRNRDDNAALGRFLSMVNSGRVPVGSYLLVESLDRLSREQVLDALNLFTTIVRAGIVIVTLKDKKIYSQDAINAQPMDLMFSIMIMMRGHDESATKSFRVGEAWASKRLEAAASGKAMTAICPGWLRKSGDSYQIISERAEIVRQIFDDCIRGYGTRTIAKRLNEARVQPWGRGRLWYDSYIKKILENPAVIGEYTPRGPLAGGTDQTASETLTGYFPAVIDTDTFWKARHALKARASSSVRASAGKHRNILSGLLKCGLCGSGMHYISKGSRKKAGKPFLQCGSSLLRGGCENTTRHPYEAVEGHILINLSTSTPRLDAEHDDVSALETACEEAEQQLHRMLDLVEQGIGGDITIRRAAAAEKRLTDARSALRKATRSREAEKVERNLRAGFRKMALTALALRREPENVHLRAEMANLLRNTVHTITLSPGAITLTYPWAVESPLWWRIDPSFAEQVTRALHRFAR